MAILYALLLLLGRSSGRILNTVFGWAIVLFFGRLPEARQLYLSLMAFASVAWLFVLLGIPFPEVGALLLTFVPLPEWVSRAWIRLVMLLATVLIPLGVGLFSVRVQDPLERPETAPALLRAALSGYSYALGISLALVLMTLFTPLVRLRLALRLWSTEHLPLAFPGGYYPEVVRHVGDALRARGWKVEIVPASRLLQVPSSLLLFLAGKAVGALASPGLERVRTPELEVVIHPSDLVFNGRQPAVAQARAAVVEELAFSRAWLTWSAEGHRIESHLASLGRGLQGLGPARPREEVIRALQDAEAELKQTALPYEEWEVLFRELLLIYRALVRKYEGDLAVLRPSLGARTGEPDAEA